MLADEWNAEPEGDKSEQGLFGCVSALYTSTKLVFIWLPNFQGALAAIVH
jgi:hypothetical protein